MKTFLHTLLAVFLILPIVAGAIWWWSIQPGLLPLSEPQKQTLTLSNGLQVELLSDPELPQTHLQWYWALGTAADPEDALGRHQLFTQAVLSGQATAELPSLAVQLARDPLGQAQLHIDRGHTLLRLQTSVGATELMLNHLLELLNQRSWEPELWHIYRESLTPIDPAYAFLPIPEAQHIDRLQAAVRPIVQPVSIWFELTPEAISRQLTDYRDAFLKPSLMRLSIQSPMPMLALEAMTINALEHWMPQVTSRTNAVPRVDEQGLLRGAMRYGIGTDDEVPTKMRLMFPWVLTQTLRADVAEMLAWLNAPIPEAPRRQLQSAGLIRDLSAQATDEFLWVTIELADAVDEPVLLASVQQLLAGLLTSDQRQLLRLDLNHFWQFDLSAQTDWAEIAIPNVDAALALPLPPPTKPLAEVKPTTASQYHLMGHQPQLIQANDQWQVWHLPDRHFGTRLTHLSVRWPFAVDSDPLMHAQWQQWLERQGPGLTDAVWQAQRQVFSPAQGFSVQVDSMGFHWHITHDWPTLAQWFPQWLADMQELEMPPLPWPEAELAYQQLLRERAQPTVPDWPIQSGPLQILISGRVESAELLQWLSTLTGADPATGVEAPAIWRLGEGHRLAELHRPGPVSRVSTWVELPSADERQLTLAKASLSWIKAHLEQQLVARDIPAQLSVAITTPLGQPGLEVILESQTLDPARLNLQLTALWRDLNVASQGRSAESLRADFQWRAERYREAPPSVAAASQYFYADMIHQRRHFNGRLRSARTLESTNIEGWAFFMHQWLFSTTARRLTVNEVGEDWAETYRELRRPPPDARPW